MILLAVAVALAASQSPEAQVGKVARDWSYCVLTYALKNDDPSENAIQIVGIGLDHCEAQERAYRATVVRGLRSKGISAARAARQADDLVDETRVTMLEQGGEKLDQYRAQQRGR